MFNSTADGYYRDRSRLIPRFDAFYRWAIDLISAGARDVVDLGAGTGLIGVITQSIPFIGYPRALSGLRAIDEVTKS